MDEREGDRQVQARVLPGFIAEGDKLAGEGKLAEAVAAYGRVFSGFQYRGVFFGDGRCLSVDFYQERRTKYAPSQMNWPNNVRPKAICSMNLMTTAWAFSMVSCGCI